MRLTDEQLMALADGYASDDREKVEKSVEALSDEERRAFEEFRRTRDLVRAAYAEELDEPLPAGLVAMVKGQPTAVVREGEGAKVVPLAPRTAKPRRRSILAFAMAASIVAVAVGLAIWEIPGAQKDDAGMLAVGPVPAASELANVLNSRPSGDPVELARRPDGVTRHLMIAGTYRDGALRVCREIEVLDKDLVPQVAGIACRSPENGLWSVEGAARIAGKGADIDSKFGPAGSDEQDPLRALNARLGLSAALTPDEERQLIATGWK